jgi:predicted secreted protein
MPRNPSAKQRETSRRNGARSRGPITLEGRITATIAPFKHGRYATFPCVLQDEDSDGFRAYFQSLVRRFCPADDSERQLCESIASIDWRLNRVAMVESRAIDNEERNHLPGAMPENVDLSPADYATSAIASLLGRSKLLQYTCNTESRLVARRASLLRQLLLQQKTRPASMAPVLYLDPNPQTPPTLQKPSQPADSKQLNPPPPSEEAPEPEPAPLVIFTRDTGPGGGRN